MASILGGSGIDHAYEAGGDEHHRSATEGGSGGAAAKEWRLPARVFADRYTPVRKVRRLRRREVRQYYYALNDMIRKYLDIDKVHQRFERRMRRLRSQQLEAHGGGHGSEGRMVPYTWHGTAHLDDADEAARADGERELPNHHYYRPHDRPKRDAGAEHHMDERTPLVGPSKPQRQPGSGLRLMEEGAAAGPDADDDYDDDEEEAERKRLEQEDNSWHVRMAIHATFWINVALFFAKTFASVESLSLSIIASALDSFLDLLSGSVIFFASWIVSSRSRELRFPGGTSRVEPLAVLIFAVAMFTATTQLLIRSMETLATGRPNTSIGWVSMGIIAFTVFIKLVLWAYCSTVRNSESVEAMKIDNRNDVITNTYGLLMIFFASRYYWWMDPLGMSLYIMFVWFRQGYANVKVMSGMSATPDFLNQLVYMAYNHHPSVVAVDTVRAYHLAYNYLVEVDIVLPEDMTVVDAHDIGEALQDKIEMLENVERAWVHIDYEYSHRPEHKKNFG